MAPTSAAIVAFPRVNARAAISDALKRHRLPELLTAQLVREAGRFIDVSADAALAFALDSRMISAPIDFEKARGILLVGAGGAGKSAVAAKIMHAAQLMGRKTEAARADGGLALFRSRTPQPGLLTVMEADGFNPLNARAASAFSALGDTPGVETIGVVSALGDAEDVADLVAAFRFPPRHRHQHGSHTAPWRDASPPSPAARGWRMSPPARAPKMRWKILAPGKIGGVAAGSGASLTFA